MASVNNQRGFHVFILLFLVTFVISSSLGSSLMVKRQNLIARKNGQLERNQTTTSAPYQMKSAELPVVGSTESSTESPFTTLTISPNASESANSTLFTNATLSASPSQITNATLSASPSQISDTGAMLHSESPPAPAEEEVTWHTKDLLVHVPRSVSLLAQLMTLSTTQLDTAFRGTSQRNRPSTSIQYNQSFRTTLLQISQKLSNAFLLASTNSENIESSLLDAPERVADALRYLRRFKNSSQNANFFVLPLKTLKDTTDSNLNLSTEIVSQLSGLVQLTEEFVKTVNSSKTEKEQQREDVIANFQSTETEKTIIENEIQSIENTVQHLKDNILQYKIQVEAASANLEKLIIDQKDESRCYWSWNQKEKQEIIKKWKCPYKPDDARIQEAEKAKEAAPQKLYELSMKQYSEIEKVAQEKRENDNKLLIKMKKLFAEKNQLDDDIKLLEKSSSLVIELLANFRMMENSWVPLVSFCEKIQEIATESHTLVNQTIENPSSWSSTLSDVLAVQLNDTKENLSLLKTIISSYVEGYRQNIAEIVAEVEQMMTKRGNNPRELERRLLAKCKATSGKIEHFFQSRYSQLREVDSQVAKRLRKLE